MKKEKLDLLLGEIQMYLDISEEEAAHVVEMVKEALIWHGPDMAPKGNQYVLNQSRERVTWDSYDKEWYSYDIPTRLAHVEKWRYPEPKPIKR